MFGGTWATAEDIAACPACASSDRVYRLDAALGGWASGTAIRPPVAADRAAGLREALAVPDTVRRVTVNDVLRAYNSVATAGRLFGLRLPHLGRIGYDFMTVLCGFLAAGFVWLAGQGPLQFAVLAVVFGALTVFFALRWREAAQRTKEQALQVKKRDARWATLHYCDKCQDIFSDAGGGTMRVATVRAYVDTGVILDGTPS